MWRRTRSATRSPRSRPPRPATGSTDWPVDGTTGLADARIGEDVVVFDNAQVGPRTIVRDRARLRELAPREAQKPAHVTGFAISYRRSMVSRIPSPRSCWYR